MNNCYSVFNADGKLIAGGSRTSSGPIDVPQGGRSATWTQDAACPLPSSYVTVPAKAIIPAKISSGGMTTTTKIAIGAAVLAAYFLFARRK